MSNMNKILQQQKVKETVKALAPKYGFDYQEAVRVVSSDWPYWSAHPYPGSLHRTSIDGPKKKERRSGYLLFSNFSREEAKKELFAQLKDDERIKQTDIIMLIAKNGKIFQMKIKSSGTYSVKNGMIFQMKIERDGIY